MISKAMVGVAAGVCGTLFIGYCIYFDRKRRSDPLFRQKLKERRLKAKKKNKEKDAAKNKLPDFRDTEAVQKFFLEQVQLGEELLAQGDFENGVEHLTNAVAVCGQPQQLLQVLQQTLPTQVFQMLLQRLPTVSQRIANEKDARFRPAKVYITPRSLNGIESLPLQPAVEPLLKKNWSDG